MQQIITLLHVFAAICLIALILLQQGKGSEMGANFGAGASGTMFGSQGSTPFMVKITGILALVFFLTSAVLSFIINKHIPNSSNIIIPQSATTPTMPGPTDAGTSKQSSAVPPSDLDQNK